MKVVKGALQVFSFLSLLAGSTGLFTYCNNDDTLSVGEHSFVSEKLPSTYHKVIIQLSDFHNHSIRYKDNVSLIDTINSSIQKKKLASSDDVYVVFTGDMIDDHTTEEDLASFRSLIYALSEYRMYFVDGNHEASCKNEDIVKKCHAIFEEFGATCLDSSYLREGAKGSQVVIDEHLSISGLADPGYRKKDGPFIGENVEGIDEQLEGLKPTLSDNRFNILLSHRPYLFKKSSEYSFDLTLSGHTHGGQIKFFGWHMLNYPFDAFKEGPFNVNGHDLIVSRGLGVSYNAPVRYRCPAELVVCDISGKQ